MFSSPLGSEPLSLTIPPHTAPPLLCSTPPMSPRCCSAFVDASASPDAPEDAEAPSTPTAREQQQRKRPAAAHHRDEAAPLLHNKRAKTFPLANMDSAPHHGSARGSGCLVDVGTASIKQQAAAWLETRQQQQQQPSFNTECGTSLFSRSGPVSSATAAATGVEAWSSLLRP
jgi:hypothetical protein